MSVYLEFPSLSDYPVYLPDGIVNGEDGENGLVVDFEKESDDVVLGLVDERLINALNFRKSLAQW